MKTFINEFKNFAVKGNMVDMAIGIIMGTAFNKIVSALVKNVFMPPLGLLTGEVSLADRVYVIREATATTDAVVLGYGIFLEAVIDFLIIGLTVFIVVKTMNRFKSKAEDPKNETVETPKNIELLSKIEQLMEEQNRLLRANSKAS
jgi:large conductance mechanosensitive channel